MKTKYLIHLIFLLLFTVCSKSPTESEPSGMSTVAALYLDKALDIMQTYSINRYRIDWPNFRQRVIETAGDAQETADTYDAIRFALVELGDNHGYFLPPDQVNSNHKTFPGLLGRRLTERVGYIRIPGFSGSGTEATEFADAIKHLVEQVDTTTVRSWIVDLRLNSGGNMWSMLAGIGPVLGEGHVGSFIFPDSVIQKWYYEDGASRLDERIFAKVTGTAYNIHHAAPPVAVLISSITYCSGEAVLVAFRGRLDTRSFGQSTSGFSVVRRGYNLSDGAMLVITVGMFADRTGYLYGGVIEPDEYVAGKIKAEPLDSDKVVEAALVY